MKNINYTTIMAGVAAAAIFASAIPATAAGNKNSTPERLKSLLGSKVLTSDREDAGKLNNLVLDLESGHVLFALVGTGEGRVALPPGVFTSTRGDTVHLNIKKDAVESAPKVTEDMMTREKLSQASFVNRVFRQFNEQPWWKGSAPADQGEFHNVHAGEDLIGMKVQNVMDKDIGEVRNAVIDLSAGRIVYVAIEPDKDLNLGDKLFALPPSALTLGKGGKTLVSNVDREKLNAAPSFAPDKWPSMTDQAFASRVYQYYGKQAYFESGAGSNLQPTGSESGTYNPDNR